MKWLPKALAILVVLWLLVTPDYGRGAVIYFPFPAELYQGIFGCTKAVSRGDRETVTFDRERLVSELTALAEAGDADAQQQLYWAMRISPEASYWLCASANNGDGPAQRRLAHLYRGGLEYFPQDDVKVYIWYSLAELNKPPYASEHYVLRIRDAFMSAEGHKQT